jgi:hypothetical protein
MSYKALLVRKREFAYEYDKTGNITYESFTFLRMIYIVVNPNVVVDVKDLQNKIEKMTLLTLTPNFTPWLPPLKNFNKKPILTKEKTSSRTISFLLSFFALQRLQPTSFLLSV